ncbi:hypothetical protein DPX16_11950 [Anabarilius grahami]|uniref:Uncharacterized protein n=1 Tax=Anabarilius grahami TaxID=495550 RepID=A0A3N0YDR5_ANAGA|nr:hypothetical protein DPX16_11950 [Anabarilius grahami]
MSDKRQRARVQGSWAKPLHKPQQPTGMTTLQTCTYYNTSQDAQSGSWKYGPRSFEFNQPADVRAILLLLYAVFLDSIHI